MAHGGTMGILNVGLLKQVDVILPPLKLQREFANRLQVLEKLDKSLLFSVDGSVNLFNSLMQHAFKGGL
jgi:type I restriction enzyme S subunit